MIFLFRRNLYTQIHFISIYFYKLNNFNYRYNLSVTDLNIKEFKSLYLFIFINNKNANRKS